ncbi:MAG: polyketide synthase module, partial [Acidobacteria bacterium]
EGKVSRDGGALPAMRESFFEVRGLGLAVCSWGEDDAPLVLCVHGGLDQGASWEEVARYLLARGYRVAAPDLRGHGRSSHPGAEAAYNLFDFVGDLDALVPKLARGPLVLVGHSFGAGVAALYAAARACRPGAELEALVLVEPVTTPEFGAAPDDLARQLDYLSLPAEQPVLSGLDAAADRLRSRTPALSPEWARRMAARLTESCDGGLRWRWDGRLVRSQIVSFGVSAARFPALIEREIGVGVTLVYGAGGGLLERPEQERLSRAARTVVLPGGHNLHVESPAELAAAIADAHSRRTRTS